MRNAVTGDGLLTLDAVTLKYGPRTILSDVSLAIDRGKVVALIGPNGAGKSTLIRAASGRLQPAAGTITVDGAHVHHLLPQQLAQKIAVVPQAVRLPEAFTVLDTVLMGRTPYLGWLGRESKRDVEVADAAMKRVGAAGFGPRRLGEISSGEQQLALIARSLCQTAPFLLMDEPTAHLDLKHESGILDLVRNLAHRDHLAVLVVLHDLNLASRFADQVALVANGELRAWGPPADVLTQENLSAAYGVPINIFPHPDGGYPVIFAEQRDPGAGGG